MKQRRIESMLQPMTLLHRAFAGICLALMVAASLLYYWDRLIPESGQSITRLIDIFDVVYRAAGQDILIILLAGALTVSWPGKGQYVGQPTSAGSPYWPIIVTMLMANATFYLLCWPAREVLRNFNTDYPSRGAWELVTASLSLIRYLSVLPCAYQDLTRRFRSRIIVVPAVALLLASLYFVGRAVIAIGPILLRDPGVNPIVSFFEMAGWYPVSIVENLCGAWLAWRIIRTLRPTAQAQATVPDFKSRGPFFLLLLGLLLASCMSAIYFTLAHATAAVVAVVRELGVVSVILPSWLIIFGGMGMGAVRSLRIHLGFPAARSLGVMRISGISSRLLAALLALGGMGWAGYGACATGTALISIFGDSGGYRQLVLAVATSILFISVPAFVSGMMLLVFAWSRVRR